MKAKKGGWKSMTKKQRSEEMNRRRQVALENKKKESDKLFPKNLVNEAQQGCQEVAGYSSQYVDKLRHQLNDLEDAKRRTENAALECIEILLRRVK